MCMKEAQGPGLAETDAPLRRTWRRSAADIGVEASQEGGTTLDLHEALYTTRAMRRLKPDPIPYDVQARILDAAIRAPHIGEGWRFILVDDPEIKSQLAPLYRKGFERMVGRDLEAAFGDLMKADTPMGRTIRSGL